MPSSTKTTSESTSSNKIDPAQFQQYQDNYATAKNNAASLTPYTGQLTAGFNPTQVQAQGILSGVATDPRYAAANNNAVGAVQGVLNNPLNGQINPQSITASPINASSYNAAQLAGTDLSPYLNPYTNDVVNTSLADLQRSRDQQQVNDNQSATASHAFGGTRQAVQNSLTSNDYLRNVASTTANLRNVGYQNAQGAAFSDIGARNQAGQYNATNAQNANIFNSGQDFNAQQFNSGQDFNAQQNTFANKLAANNLTLNAAGQLVATNNNGLDLAKQQGGILSAVGDTQQAQTQNELSNAYQAYMTGQQLTVQQQALLNQALSMIPVQQTQQSNGTQTQTTNPGAMGIIGGLGSLALAAGTGGASAGLTGALSGLGSSLFGGSAPATSAGGYTVPGFKYGGIFG